MKVKQHIDSIDYLRALMSVFVVLWHMGGAGKSGLYTPEFAQHQVSLPDILNFYVLLLAVPTFFFVSFYLFALVPRSFKTLMNRMSRFLILLLFWTVIYTFIVRGGFEGLGYLYKYLIQSPVSAYWVVFNAGGSVYYFFSSLFLLVFLVFAFHGANNRMLFAGLLVTTLSLAVIPSITEATGFILLSAYWSPLNFTPYIFLGLLFARNQEVLQRLKWKLAAWLAVGFLAAAVFEWNFSIGVVHFKSQTYAIPCYMRPSLVFAVAIIGLLMLTSNIRSNIVVRFMARYSLALFCLHPFFIIYTKKLVGDTGVLDNLIATFIVILFSYATAFLLKRFLNKAVLF